MTNRRPSIFLGSSSEGLRIAKTLQVLLDRAGEVTVWSQGVFGLSEGTLESLVYALDGFDFAVLILTADDLVTGRETAPRDNVLFELGLFMGGLGRNRTFIVYDRTANVKLPSDLAGVSAATFEPHSSGNLKSALGAAARRIEDQVARLGVCERESSKQLSHAAQELDNATTQMHKLIGLIARSRKVELEVIASQFGPLIPEDKLELIRRDLNDLSQSLDEGHDEARGKREDQSVMSPLRRKYVLANLLEGVTPQAMREAFDWGPDKGREIVE